MPCIREMDVSHYDLSAIQQNNQINQSDSAGLPQRVVSAIKQASERTGVDFSYMLNKAQQESGFDPQAKSKVSSATGLYQFTNQTWLRMVKNNGADYGLGAYADHIKIDATGTAHVTDPAWRKAILDLRKDPQLSAEMAGELDKQNLDALQGNVGGRIGGTELYLAHFLGAGGATDFLNELHANPSTVAANVVPQAASNNPSIFYNSDGSPRTLGQIYHHFAQKFGNGVSNLVASANAILNSGQSATANASIASAANVGAMHVINQTTSAGSQQASLLSQMTGGNNGVTGIHLASNTSSLFTTMLLAQSNISESTLSASGQSSHFSKNGHKDVLQLLGGTA